MADSIRIELAKGAEDVGLAVMLKDLLAQNLEQNPHKVKDFIKLSISVGIIISDADVELTLSFSKGTLTIHGGIAGDPGLVITAEADTIMDLSNLTIRWGMPYYFDDTGMRVLKCMLSGRLKVRGMLFHFPSLILISRVMSVR
ncbi:MAG: hypothetical protein JXO48_04580 [Deltaproteobacteria bacterium]|nr:hypothetical protein [Deltaproteobacteria bacterium]